MIRNICCNVHTIGNHYAKYKTLSQNIKYELALRTVDKVLVWSSGEHDGEVGTVKPVYALQ